VVGFATLERECRLTDQPLQQKDDAISDCIIDVDNFGPFAAFGMLQSLIGKVTRLEIGCRSF